MLAASSRDYQRGSVRLDVLRGAVPCLVRAVDEALSRQFGKLHEYTLRASDRAVESVPKRVGAELLCWGRRCDAAVAVPPAWLVASGARFVAGNAHRREVLHVLKELWAAQAELAGLERELAPPDAAPASSADQERAELWVVDFRRMPSAAAAMTGPIPVCSLDGRTLDAVPAEHAAAMRARSPRLADALRIGHANFEHWAARVDDPACVGAEGAEAEVYRQQVAAYVQSPGATACKSLVYFLDTWHEGGHRPGALASQVYVGIVGSKDGEQLVNSLGKRMLQHLSGDEMLVDLELQNPALRRCPNAAESGAAAPGPRPEALVLPLDFGVPGLHGKHSVGALEGVYMRYFDCVSPLGLNATRSRGERAFSLAAWAMFVELNADYICACVAAGAACAFCDTAAVPAALRDGVRAARPEAVSSLVAHVTLQGDFSLHDVIPSQVEGVPFQALLDRAIETDVVCMDAYKTTAKQRALYGATPASLLRAQRTGCGAALNTDLIHDSTGENGNYAFWHRATHDSGWSLTRLLYPRNPAKVTDAEIRDAMAEAKAAREVREAAAPPAAAAAESKGKRRCGGKRATAADAAADEEEEAD